MRINNLPNWCIPDSSPTFYDTDSKSVLDQTAKLYGIIKKLVADYNEYAKQLDKGMENFEEEVKKLQSEFEEEITKVIHDYIIALDAKVDHQDRVIEENITYIKNNIGTEVTRIIDEMKQSGELDAIIADSLDSVNERIATIEGSITTIQENVNNLIPKVTTNETNIKALQTTTSNLDKRIEDVETSEVIDINAREKLDNLYYKNIKEYGALGDGLTDDTQAFKNALEAGVNVYIPEGTYIISDSLNVKPSTIICGEKEKSILKYKGTGRCLVVCGRYVSIKDLKVVADTTIESNEKVGITVNPNVTDTGKSTFTNVLIESIFVDGFNTCISLDNMWQVTIRNCILKGKTKGSDLDRTCYGVSYEMTGNVLANWSGSGNIIESCYITNCSYAFNFKGAWNVTSIDNVIEGNYSSMYRDTKSMRLIFINNWFEKNEASPELNGPILMIGGRKNTLYNSSELEFPPSLNHLYLIDQSGNSLKNHNQVIFNNIPNEEAVLSGIKNYVQSSDGTKLASLKGYSSYGVAIKDTGVKDENLTGEISIVGYGKTGGDGKTYSRFKFASGQTNGNNADVPIRDVFEVDENGTITSPHGTGVSDIGNTTHLYNRIYTNKIVMKNSEGNLYVVTIDASGNLKAAKI